MEQAETAAGNYQVNRDAVGDGYRKEDTAGLGDPAVDPLDLDPPSAGVETHDLDAVHLIAQSDGMECR
jgi:hypothetical protein